MRTPREGMPLAMASIEEGLERLKPEERERAFTTAHDAWEEARKAGRVPMLDRCFREALDAIEF